MLRIEVLGATQSGEHKVKVLGVIVSPDAGDHTFMDPGAHVAVDFDAHGQAAFSGR